MRFWGEIFREGGRLRPGGAAVAGLGPQASGVDVLPRAPHCLLLEPLTDWLRPTHVWEASECYTSFVQSLLYMLEGSVAWLLLLTVETGLFSLQDQWQGCD